MYLIAFLVNPFNSLIYLFNFFFLSLFIPFNSLIYVFASLHCICCRCHYWRAVVSARATDLRLSRARRRWRGIHTQCRPDSPSEAGNTSARKSIRNNWLKSFIDMQDILFVAVHKIQTGCGYQCDCFFFTRSDVHSPSFNKIFDSSHPLCVLFEKKYVSSHANKSCKLTNSWHSEENISVRNWVSSF